MEVKVRKIKDGLFPINHEMAGLVPLALPNEQMALTLDIQENGLRMPIVLWKGKIVDGRSRQKALETIGGTIPIEYTELDDELTEVEVAAYVKSVNTRRNLTITQKTMSAARATLDPLHKTQNRAAAKSWGVSLTAVKNAKHICKKHPETADILFNGYSVEIVDSKGMEVSSNKVSTVYAYCKRLEEGMDPIEPHGYMEKTKFVNQVAKDYYYKTIDDIKVKGNIPAMICIQELANYKGREQEKSIYNKSPKQKESEISDTKYQQHRKLKLEELEDE